MELTDVYVVLPAGGCGLRMEVDTPKQYCKVLNRPLILFTIQSFHRLQYVKQIVIVVGDKYMEYMKNLLTKYRFTKVDLVEGSTTRHRSIYNGVKALEKVCKPDDIVIIHDAVRMFTDEQTITQVAMAAKQYKASGVYRPLISTVIAPASTGFLEESLDRNKYRASEMPQGFHYHVILSSYQKATYYDFDYGTECLHLASKYTGVKVKLIEGSSNLWKVTHKKDLYAAEGILKETSIGVCLKCNHGDLKASFINKLRNHKFEIQAEADKEIDPSVYIHVLNYDLDIKDKCLKCLEQFKDSNNSTDCTVNLLDRVLMFVVKITYDSDGLSLIHLMRDLKKQINEDSLIYCVVFQEFSQAEQLSSMATSVVWNRDPVLSGQVLFV